MRLSFLTNHDNLAVMFRVSHEGLNEMDNIDPAVAKVRLDRQLNVQSVIQIQGRIEKAYGDQFCKSTCRF